MPISKIKTSSITADAASINLNIDAGTLFLDVANNRVGVTNTSPAATLDVRTSTASSYTGVFYNTSATGQGVTIRAGSTSSQDTFNCQTYDGGLSLFKVGADGNVGVGIASPAATLHVNASGGGTIRASRSSVSGEYIQMDHDGSNGTLRASGANALIFNTNSAERMRINNGGQVQIGLSQSSTVGQLQVKAQTAQAGTNTYYAQTWSSGNYADAGSYTTMLGFGVEGHSWSKGAFGYTRTSSYDRGYMAFYTNGVADSSTCALADERMRISNNGKVWIGTNTGDAYFGSTFVVARSTNDVVGFVETSTNAGNTVQTNKAGPNGTDTTTTYLVVQRSDGTSRGSIMATGTNSCVYNTSSDYRLKTVVGPLSNSGSRIDALEPIEFVWNEDESTDRGFLAHKFKEVYPRSVSGEKDEIDANGNPKYQSMQASTAEVIADLVAEIQSLRQRVAALENK